MPDEVRIEIAETDEQIGATWEVMRQLRPHLGRDEYVAMARGMAGEGYRVAAAIADGRVVAVAGFRFMTMLYCGRLLYLDDLVSDEAERSRGYGRLLLDWLKDRAREAGCSELQLISRTTRERAHRFYFREGFGIECFQFRYPIE